MSSFMSNPRRQARQLDGSSPTPVGDGTPRTRPCRRWPQPRAVASTASAPCSPHRPDQFDRRPGALRPLDHGHGDRSSPGRLRQVVQVVPLALRGVHRLRDRPALTARQSGLVGNLADIVTSWAAGRPRPAALALLAVIASPDRRDHPEPVLPADGAAEPPKTLRTDRPGLHRGLHLATPPPGPLTGRSRGHP